jgi:ketosteroid isomerase-like protein
MANSPLTAARTFYDRIHAGDFTGLFELLAEDCVIEFFGPAIIPFAGRFIGREKCRLFFDHVANDIDIHEFRQDDFLPGDAMIAVTGHLHLSFKATGRDYASDYVHIIHVRDDEITRFRDFQDSAQAAYVCADVSTPVR